MIDVEDRLKRIIMEKEKTYGFMFGKPGRIPTTDELKIIGAMTVKLTEMKLELVPHIAIENFASGVFMKLLKTLTSIEPKNAA